MQPTILEALSSVDSTAIRVSLSFLAWQILPGKKDRCNAISRGAEKMKLTCIFVYIQHFTIINSKGRPKRIRTIRRTVSPAVIHIAMLCKINRTAFPNSIWFDRSRQLSAASLRKLIDNTPTNFVQTQKYLTAIEPWTCGLAIETCHRSVILFRVSIY